MTSRPHFRHETSPHQIRRIRSISLGSSVDAARVQQTMRLEEYPVHFDDWRDYVLPSKALSTAHNVPQTASVHNQLKSLIPSPTLQVEDVPLLLGSRLEDISVVDERKKEMGDITSSTKRLPSSDTGNPVWLCVMYGLINATIVLPVLMSFASIIYRDQAFAPAMPTLVKLTLISGMVHQVCFSTFSSLPFSIGQVSFDDRI